MPLLQPSAGTEKQCLNANTIASNPNIKVQTPSCPSTALASIEPARPSCSLASSFHCMPSLTLCEAAAGYTRPSSQGHSHHASNSTCHSRWTWGRWLHVAKNSCLATGQDGHNLSAVGAKTTVKVGWGGWMPRVTENGTPLGHFKQLCSFVPHSWKLPRVGQLCTELLKLPGTKQLAPHCWSFLGHGGFAPLCWTGLGWLKFPGMAVS